MAISRIAKIIHLFVLIRDAAKVKESYLEMAFTDSATCAPVGMAWKKIIELIVL